MFEGGGGEGCTGRDTTRVGQARGGGGLDFLAEGSTSF